MLNYYKLYYYNCIVNTDIFGILGAVRNCKELTFASLSL